MPQNISILFPAVTPTSTYKERNDSTNTVNLARPLSFPTPDIDVVVIAKSNYKIGNTYGISVIAMHAAGGPLGSGAGVNLIHSSLVPAE